MAFTPFMQGKDAQSVINNYLGQNVSASTPMSPMDMNQYGVFRNPYSPKGFYANETDMYPVEAYTQPVIDNEGIPFLYEKTHSSSLKYYKIRKVERKNSASVVWLKGINFPFKIPRPPNADTSWAGVLHLSGIPWILYEYSEFQKSDTRRKV